MISSLIWSCLLKVVGCTFFLSRNIRQEDEKKKVRFGVQRTCYLLIQSTYLISNFKHHQSTYLISPSNTIKVYMNYQEAECDRGDDSGGNRDRSKISVTKMTSK